MANGFTIGRLSVVVFENWICGGGKTPNQFRFTIKRHGVSIQIFKWVLRIDIKRKLKFKSGKAISIQEFKTLMQGKGVDLSKSKMVEISINGIKEV